MKTPTAVALVITTAIFGLAGTAQAEGINIKINRSKDNVGHSFFKGLAPAEFTLNVPECSGPFINIIGYKPAFTTCGSKYVLEFRNGKLINFHVE